MNKKLFAAIATLTGTVIGAGFLGIPYVTAKSGFFIGLFHIIILGIALLLVNLSLGEIALRTKADHQLPGYAEKYLGKYGKILMFFSMIFGIYSALLAYLIGEGESLSYLFFSHSGYAIYFAIAFWLFMAFLVYKGLRALKKGESIGLILVGLIVLSIFIFYAPSINLNNITYFKFSNWFWPFGVVLFALLGFSTLPELERELKGSKKLMKKAIIIGYIIPIVVYIIFTFVVLGVFGESVKEVATLSLAKVFVILGIITMYTAFFALSMALKDMYRFDLMLSNKQAMLLVSGIPLILYFLVRSFNLASFTAVLGAGGIVSGGITGILIILMSRNAKKLGDRKPEYSININKIILFLLALLFLAGIILNFIY